MTFIRPLVAAAAFAFALGAQAQQKEIKIGFIYDVSGPFAGGGSEPAQVGTKAIVDYFNERGGVAGYKIVPIFADAQSKVDVAINEMTRLIDQEKVDIVSGVYSSAQCVPMAQQADSRKKFLWLNVCVASSVMKDKKFQYVFRPTVHSDQYGNATCSYVHNYSQSKFGIAPKNMRIAIIHEEATCKQPLPYPRSQRQPRRRESGTAWRYCILSPARDWVSIWACRRTTRCFRCTRI